MSTTPRNIEAAHDAHLTLIICTYRRPAEMRRLLESLVEQTRRPDDILVIDGSPDDETAHAIATCDAGAPVRYVRVPPEERGLTRQRNRGIAETDARSPRDIVAFLDDDTIPAPTYFAEVLACFERHPEAVGVGAALDEVTWRQVDHGADIETGEYAHLGWARREDLRWRLRRALRLDSTAPPGHMPPGGHPRPLSFLPPDGNDHRVEFLMGGAAAWRHGLLARLGFSPYFAGYGLYEDLDFSIRAHREGSLFLATRARARHEHAPSGRPNRFRYGVMVARNGWLVWRARWPRPPIRSRLKWWLTSAVLAGCRLADAFRSPPLPPLTETLGRGAGLLSVLVRHPEDPHVG